MSGTGTGSAGITLSDGTMIPLDELELRFTRSGGPGGQHVNTSSTQVEVRFDVAGSPSLSQAQRERVLRRLAARLTGDGVLVLRAREHRSQMRNRQAALERLQRLLDDALRVVRPRRATRPSVGAQERRRQSKRRRAEVKSRRRRPDPE